MSAIPVLLDPHYFDHPKVVHAGLEASTLHLRMICHANAYLTDGYVPHEHTLELSRRVLAMSHGPLVPATITEQQALIDSATAVRLIHQDNGGYRIHDYAEHQETRGSLADQEEVREGWRLRKRRQRTRDIPRDIPRDMPVTLGVTSPSDQKGFVLPTALTSDQASDLTVTQGLPLTWGTAASKLRGADELTPAVLLSFARVLPEAALHNAFEALQTRRGKQPPLASEARYLVAVLKQLRDEGVYARA